MSSDITANSNRLFPPNAETRSSGPTTTNKKLRPSASTSSEFLYLGTLVNSRSGGGIDDRPGLDARKLASPELHLLPPLARQANGNNGEEEEEDEEFYSLRVSLGGSGSGSRRAFAAVGKIIDLGSSSSYSCSTSESGSPAWSHSISLSPPTSWSPNRRSSQPNLRFFHQLSTTKTSGFC
uniref:Uncharacterized protein n=1 Tax=Fagus sylvatica TaxID=28930 RepID=A0A2N9IYX9_FAGSY